MLEFLVPNANLELTIAEQLRTICTLPHIDRNGRQSGSYAELELRLL